MNKNAFALTLDGDGFAAVRSDFNQIFNALIETMISKEAETGSITIKLNVSLNDGFAPDREEVRYAAEREIISPKIEHTITSAFQIKDKRTGLTGGDTYEIIWDKAACCWVMAKITDAQGSVFDEEYDDGSAKKDEPDADAEEGEDDA